MNDAWGVTIVDLKARQHRKVEQRRAAQRVRYARIKAENTASYQRLVGLIWEHNRAKNAGMTLAQYRAQPRVQLVCCDVWQAVTTLPHRCEYCGRTYLESAGEGR